MDVPEMMLKFTLLESISKLDGPVYPVQPARIFTPGAMTSGLRISEVRWFGPRLENAATFGAGGEVPITVPLNAIVAIGDGSDLTYCLIASPAVCPTIVAGTTCESAISSSPLSSVFANIIPAPPATLTAYPLSTLALPPRSQTTIFPATFDGSRLPE
ncbi:hypothetical protein NMG60_11002374 [Bertholletia excelsa]